MSLQTWVAEFYPETAEEAAAGGDAAAVEHSLRKWEGLKFENLERHDVGAGSRAIHESDTGRHIEISSKTCALCVLHEEQYCCTCPLYKARGDFACDTRTPDEDGAPGLPGYTRTTPSP